MKRFILLVLCIISTTSLLISQDVLHLMSLNIDAGRDGTIDSIASFINSYNADVIALQEVDIYAKRNNEIPANGNYLASLGAGTGMFSAFGKVSLPTSRTIFGNAILSKNPFTKTENILLPRLANAEQRGLMVTHLVLNNRSICVASVHLSFENEDIIETQIRHMKRYLETLDDDIVIVIGDFNLSKPHQILALMDGWQDALPKHTNTFSSRKEYYQKAKLDYILYKSILPIKVLNASIDCDPSITDHCACYVELEFPTITIPR